MKFITTIQLILFYPAAVFAGEEVLPHGIRADVEIGFRYTNELAILLGLLALGLLIWFLYQKWKKNDSQKPVTPTEPMNVRLRRELSTLAKMELTKPEQIKEFYFKLSEASRKTLELLGIGTVEQTFDEFKPLLSTSQEFPIIMRDEVVMVLERSEMVKFAKHVPNTTVCEDDLGLCFRQLDRYEEAIKKANDDAKEETEKRSLRKK